MATSVKNKTLRILCFGDSLTHGFGFGKQPHPYSNVLRERLAKALPGVKLDIVTDGLPGALASTSGFQRRLKTAFEGESFDWVILLAGTNDLNYDFPPERIFASLKEAWDTALFNNAQVLAMTLPDTPMWAPNSQKSKSKTELNKMILSHQAPNYHSFNLEAGIPFHSLAKEDQVHLWNDDVHPSKDGYNLMGDVIATELLKVLADERNRQKGASEAATNGKRSSARPTEGEREIEEERANPRRISQDYIWVRKSDLY